MRRLALALFGVLAVACGARSSLTVPPPLDSGFTDLFLHGNPMGVGPNEAEHHYPMSPEDLAQNLLNDPRYDGGAVRLLACETGAFNGQFAQRLMEDAEVAVAPGLGFGPEGEGWVRLALVENPQRLQPAVRQMKRAFQGWEG